MHTWELEENLDPRKVEEFKNQTCTPDAGQSTSTSNDQLVGFQRSLEPERILGKMKSVELYGIRF